jgi:hypothetical protein
MCFCLVSTAKITQMNPDELGLFQYNLNQEEQKIESYPFGEPVLYDLQQAFKKMSCCFS